MFIKKYFIFFNVYAFTGNIATVFFVCVSQMATHVEKEPGGVIFFNELKIFLTNFPGQKRKA